MLRIKHGLFLCHLTDLLRKTDLLLYFAQRFGGIIARLLCIFLDDLINIVLVAGQVMESVLQRFQDTDNGPLSEVN